MTLWYSLVVVGVLASGAFAVALVQREQSLDRLDGELRHLMLTLEGVMRTEFSEGLNLQASADEASRLPRTDVPAIDTVVVGSTRYRFVSRPVSHAGHQYVAAVLVPLNELEEEQRGLVVSLWTGVLVALMVAGAGGWLVGRQTLRPLSTLAAQATAITERDLSARLHAPNTRDELGSFATAFNDLLNRLAGALNAQRQFMADASHELRTPVSVVRTTAQVTLARTHRTEDEYQESFTIVAEQATRLSRLVDAMFLLSRAEAQGIPLRREPLYLDDLVAECARALRILAGERGVTIRTCGDAEVTFSGDDTLLRQMVGNLLDNAIRYAKPDGLVTATIARTPAGVTIRIVDDGEGIAADQQDRIFARFARFDERSDGAGLGLPIARWVAEAHGGTLVLESSGKGGSCFTVTLPPI